jgi:hypothetical protein
MNANRSVLSAPLPNICVHETECNVLSQEEVGDIEIRATRRHFSDFFADALAARPKKAACCPPRSLGIAEAETPNRFDDHRTDASAIRAMGLRTAFTAILNEETGHDDQHRRSLGQSFRDFENGSN